MTVVYAVCVGNYHPAEVVGVYDNIDAARSHAEVIAGLTVVRWEVASVYWPTGPPPQYCAKCGHAVEQIGNEWRCDHQCRCLMSGCTPARGIPDCEPMGTAEGELTESEPVAES